MKVTTTRWISIYHFEKWEEAKPGDVTPNSEKVDKEINAFTEALATFISIYNKTNGTQFDIDGDWDHETNPDEE